MEKESKMVNALLDAGACYFGNEQTLGMLGGLVKFIIKDENTFIIDIITVPPTKRRQGEGTKVMKALGHFADKTDTTMELTIADIKNTGGFIKNRTDIVGMNAVIKTNKIPVSKLKDWYIKFGFVPNGKEFNHVKMIRKPNKCSSTL